MRPLRTDLAKAEPGTTDSGGNSRGAGARRKSPAPAYGRLNRTGGDCASLLLGSAWFSGRVAQSLPRPPEPGVRREKCLDHRRSECFGALLLAIGRLADRRIIVERGMGVGNKRELQFHRRTAGKLSQPGLRIRSRVTSTLTGQPGRMVIVGRMPRLRSTTR